MTVHEFQFTIAARPIKLSNFAWEGGSPGGSFHKVQNADTSAKLAQIPDQNCAVLSHLGFQIIPEPTSCRRIYDCDSIIGPYLAGGDGMIFRN
jgi:hypothetical protein